MTEPVAPPAPQRLESASGVSIAYHATAGKSPGVVFLGGFMSDMTGMKAVALEAMCHARGQAFVRFDYRGHGATPARFEDLTLDDWLADALAVFDRLTQGPQVLVGSSMGGWIALLMALRRHDRVAGLVTIAAATDFTDLMWERMSDAQRVQIIRDGVVHRPSAYSTRPYVISRRLIESGRKHRLLDGPIGVGCPVRLLHGMGDPDVPWQRSLTLNERLAGRDARVILIKDGDHRLSRETDLALLGTTVAELLDGAPQR